MIRDVWNTIREQYEADVAHQFLLHLNVRDIVADTVFGYLPFTDYLLWRMTHLGEKEKPDDPDVNWLVFTYDRSVGARFPEPMRIRGGPRADFQWKYGLNAPLYKFAQNAAIRGNERAMLRSLYTLLLLHSGFRECIEADTGPGRPFERFKDNPTFRSLLETEPIIRWRQLNEGIRAAQTGVHRDTPLNDVINRLDGLLHANPYGRRVGVIIERVEMLAPNRHRAFRNELIGGTESVLVTETIARWASDKWIRGRRNLLILLTENLADVAPEILESRELSIIEVPLPDLQERRAFLRHLATLPPHWKPPPEPKDEEEARSPEYRKMIEEWPPQRERTQYPDALRYAEGYRQRDAAQQTAGLTLTGLYEAYLPVALRSGAIERRDLDRAKAREVERFSRGLLELIPPEIPLQYVGGLRHVERYFSELAPRLLAGEAESVPNGVWLFGPPGTGKTLTLFALASATILPVLRLKMPHELGIRPVEPGLTQEDDYANDLHRALAYARSIGPTVLFLDRVDVTFREETIGSEKGLSSRALGLLLDSMARADTRGRILWIGAASEPHRIQPRLLSVPLMDTLIYLLPTPTERTQILERVLQRERIPVEGGISFEQLMRHPAAEHLSGEDLATIAVRAYRRARAHGRGRVSRDDLLATLVDFVPEATPTELEWLSLNAVRFATARSQLPEEILPPLSQVILDRERIAKERIEARLRELRKHLLP